MSEMRWHWAAAVLATLGGRVEIPRGVLESVGHWPSPVIRRWPVAESDAEVWALDEPDLAEIQAGAEAAYEAWRAGQDRQAVVAAVARARERLKRVYLDTSSLPALVDTVLEAVLEVDEDEAPLPPEPQTPESWTVP